MADEITHPAAALPLPRGVGRDRVILWISLAAITLISWLYLLWMPMSPEDFGAIGRSLLGTIPSSASDAVLTFLMWTIMMVAMMLPSATPMIDTYARMVGNRSTAPWRDVAAFTSGYLLVWTFFSVVATAGQILLQKIGLITGSLTTIPFASAILLLSAGIYQITPLKNVCLTGCRSPIGFFMTSWRDGTGGALRMGVQHGALCLGCCWFLMALLFLFGAMNLIWVAALSIFVLLEKAIPGGRILAYGSGVAMIVAGVALLV
ncbi:MAG TPA: DUF2182 domain-containing protein [Candidatus Binataceae bacterium]|nr:DUF2182 domain-containing protein [Candidatus Binataceae bacterium]